MKSMYFLMAGAAALALTSCDREKVLGTSNTPGEIEAYVSTHFPSHKVLQVVEDMDGLTKTYDVLLEGNISLEFNRSKEIIDIDSEQKLPDSVIPAEIRDYVTANFASNVITDWEIEGRNQQIGLDNDLDIEFTMKGDFIRIDS